MNDSKNKNRTNEDKYLKFKKSIIEKICLYFIKYNN